MKNYSMLLSPWDCNGVLLKNRIMASGCSPTWAQGDERWPTEKMISNYANKAKSGAGIVVCKVADPVLPEDKSHFTTGEIRYAPAQGYICQMADAVHYYGAKASYFMFIPDSEPVPPSFLAGYDCTGGIASESVQGDAGISRVGKTCPEELMLRLIDEYVEEAVLAKKFGFDMCFIPMPYRMGFLGRFLSPITNQRTDKYGGSAENRARFPLMVAEAIKKACGQNFLVECSISGAEDGIGGRTVEETIDFAKRCEGKIDILQIRGPQIDPSNGCFLIEDKMPHLEYSKRITEAMHDLRCSTKIEVVCGMHDFDDCEEALEKGHADMIGVARAFIADPMWARKAYMDHKEDVVPCIRCNKCHNINPDVWLSACSVNPTFGIEDKMERMQAPLPAGRRRIGIVGGGPAGLRAAVWAFDRGHSVTIYEKSGRLGGQLNYAVIPKFKKDLSNYLEYLKCQVAKRDIRVELNTAATVEMLDAAGYDVVLGCIGAVPHVPPVKGIQGNPSVIQVLDALEHPEKLADDIVMIGGGEVAVEAAWHFSDLGKKVFIIEMQNMLAPEAPPIHFRSVFEEKLENDANIRYVVNARCTSVEDHVVSYTDMDGNTLTVTAGSIVLATGMKSCRDEAIDLSRVNAEYYMLGDCDRQGALLYLNKTVWGLVNTL